MLEYWLTKRKFQDGAPPGARHQLCSAPAGKRQALPFQENPDGTIRISCGRIRAGDVPEERFVQSRKHMELAARGGNVIAKWNIAEGGNRDAQREIVKLLEK